jgi:hypothetical protein
MATSTMLTGLETPEAFATANTAASIISGALTLATLTLSRYRLISQVAEATIDTATKARSITGKSAKRSAYNADNKAKTAPPHSYYEIFTTRVAEKINFGVRIWGFLPERVFHWYLGGRCYFF